MRIQGPTSGSIAQNVWVNIVRNLTGFGAAMAIPVAAKTTLAAGASVDLRAPAGTQTLFTIAVTSPAGASCTVQLYDGTNQMQVLGPAVGTTGGFTIQSNAAVGPRITNNDGANAASYMYAGEQHFQ